MLSLSNHFTTLEHGSLPSYPAPPGPHSDFNKHLSELMSVGLLFPPAQVSGCAATSPRRDEPAVTAGAVHLPGNQPGHLHGNSRAPPSCAPDGS